MANYTVHAYWLSCISFPLHVCVCASCLRSLFEFVLVVIVASVSLYDSVCVCVSVCVRGCVTLLVSFLVYGLIFCYCIFLALF